MSRIDDVTGGELRAILKRLAALEKATPLASASVGSGRLRFYAGSELLIEDSNLTVSGIVTIDGELVGTGTLTWSGDATFTGTTDLNGPVNIDGATDITGAVTLGSTMALTGSGKITIGGGMTLDSGGLSGGVVIIKAPTGVINLTAPVMTLAGAPTMTGKTNLNGGADITAPVHLYSLPTISAVTPNLYVHPTTNVLYRIV